MNPFEYYAPTRIVFGEGSERSVGKLLRGIGATNALVVYGMGSVERSGLLGRIRESMEAAGVGYVPYGGARPNPTLAHAEAGVCLALESKIDAVLGVGGGSAIDTAKAIAHGTANPDKKLWDIWTGITPLARSLPIGTVLTIPAAGSEMSASAVLTNVELGVKRGLGTDLNRPLFAVMNPALAATLPKKQIACGISDILMHTLDRYFTHSKGNPLTDGFAETLLRVTMDAGRKVYANPNDIGAMGDLMWCSSVSHNGLTGLGAVLDFVPHKLGHELSAMYDVPHGESLTGIWGAWAEYVYPQEPERFAMFARKVFGITEPDNETAAVRGIHAMVAYFISIDMPINLEGLNVGEVTDAAIRHMSDASQLNSGAGFGEFKRIYSEDARSIYNAARAYGK